MTKLQSRDEINVNSTWLKEAVYTNIQEWDKEYQELKIEYKKIDKFQNTLAENSDRLLEWLNFSNEIYRKVFKLVFYVQMENACNTLDNQIALLLSKAQALYSDIVAKSSFSIPEILNIPEKKINQWLLENKELAKFGHVIKVIFADKAHTRSKEIEELLGLLIDPFSSSSKTRHIILNQEVDFGEVNDSKTTKFPLAQATVGQYLGSADRELRKNTWIKYAESHIKHQESLANIYLTSVKQNILIARTKGYKSVLEYKLAPNAIDLAVFHNLISVCKSHTSTWHRYWKVLKNALKLNELKPYDIWAPLASKQSTILFSEAVEWIASGMEPLGKEYADKVRNGCLKERWVDYAQNKGKAEGAFSSGTYGTDPYIMMSYSDDIGSLSTLAHELGHSMHSYYTNKTQPFHYTFYSMFVAEVASNFNQAMVRDYLFKKFQSRDFQLEVISEAMDNIHRYFFIMPNLARFEYEVHLRLESGESLNAAELNKIMLNIYQEGYGDNLSSEEDKTAITWAQFSHLYEPFYTFQYATGISVAHSFANKIINKEDGAVDKYLNFLKAGSSDYPLNVLRTAGVDMTSTKVVEDTFLVLNSIIDRLENLS